jgi:hypothetical protein
LIDHQVGTMGWVRSIPFEEMKRNALMLAKTARILKSAGSAEEYAQGPLLSELETILPSTNQVIAELAGNWTTPKGSQIVQQVVMPALQA